MLRTYVTGCTIHKNTFSAPFGIFYVKTEIWKETFQKSPLQTSNGVLLIFKLPFPNGSYRNRVCRALWAMSMTVVNLMVLTPFLYSCYCASSQWQSFFQNRMNTIGFGSGSKPTQQFNESLERFGQQLNSLAVNP